MENLQITLAQRPEGIVKLADFDIKRVPLPKISEGEFLVRIAYISCDPAIRGWMNSGTTYMPGIKIGEVIRAFSAGEIIESKHPDYAVGTHVAGLFGVQEYAVSDGKGVTHIPNLTGSLSYHLGVLGMPGMTAYFGLLEKGQPKAGETVFVLGAAGIVGSTVGQIAKIKGCRVVGTAGTDEKCKYLTEECGFDAAINYKTEDLDAAVKKHCPDKVDVVYDNVGGPMLDIMLANLARGARVTICGAISQYNKPEIYGPKNYMKIVTARGVLNGIIVFDYIKQYPKAVNDISGWIEKGQLKVKEQIDPGIENFPKILTKLYTGDNFGKLLVKV